MMQDVTMKAAHTSNPGITPARKRSVMETIPLAPYRISGTDGGIITPRTPLTEFTAVAKDLGYFSSSMAGIMKPPIAAVVAGAKRAVEKTGESGYLGKASPQMPRKNPAQVEKALRERTVRHNIAREQKKGHGHEGKGVKGIEKLLRKPHHGHAVRDETCQSGQANGNANGNADNNKRRENKEQNDNGTHISFSPQNGTGWEGGQASAAGPPEVR